MKYLLTIYFLTALLFSQEVHFSFYSDSDQRFLVPFDTTYRQYPVPIDLLTMGSDIRFALIFDACEEISFNLDDLRFPNNGFLDFETEDFELNLSSGVLSAQRILVLPDSNYVLQVTLDENHGAVDTLWLETPENTFPSVPESVHVVIQSSASVDLWNYIPIQDYSPLWSASRYLSSHPEWDYNTLIETVYGSETSEDSIVNSTVRWHYSDSSNPEVRLDERSYTYRYRVPERISIDQMSFNFAQALNQHSGGDSTWGAALVGEQYENILGQPTFVKQYSLDGPIGSNFYFGYGVGIVREDFAGTSVHDDLVGVRRYDAVRGDFEQNVSLRLGIDQGFPMLTTLPPDSNWYQYKIPISKLYYPEYSLPRSMDSLLLVLMPEILIDDHTGLLQFVDMQLKQLEDDLIYDFSQQDISEWLLIFALNGSGMSMEQIADIFPDTSGSCFELLFYNDWQGSTHFSGFANHIAHFDSTLQLNPEMCLQFWLRQSPTVTGIEDVPELPTQPGVASAYPNPFNGSISIQLIIPEQTNFAILTIYDLQGRQVWTHENLSSGGSFQLQWYGQDQYGRALSSGVYLATLELDGIPRGQVKKLVLIK